jgi:CRISPR/Cas system CSM-associated protein Csm3 (group 7 of RAMP superfamily)
VEEIFGSASTDSPVAVGGKAEFWDARFHRMADSSRNVPYWNESRFTGVSTSVAIDRDTRVASHRRLFHREFVPPGIIFEVAVSGQDMEDDELALLIATLDGFNHTESPITLGADTGNGWGKLIWKLQEIDRFTENDFEEWANLNSPPVGYDALKPVPPAELARLQKQAASLLSSSLTPFIEADLTLYFDGPFLVNDPSHTKTGSEAESSGEADHVPLRDHLGRVVLPGASFRGCLRSQAERIVRTLNRAAACPGTGGVGACDPVYDVERVDELCLTCYVFGAPGWQGIIETSDFVSVTEDLARRQEFVAIDRFTGGVAGKRKFNADFVYRPVLKGKLIMRLERGPVSLEDGSKWHPGIWALGLLGLVLRDLVQGDITLGFGASKGYGSCKATIDRISTRGARSLDDYRELLDSCGVTESQLFHLDPHARVPLEVQRVVTEVIKRFQKKVGEYPSIAKSTSPRNG